MQKWENYSFIIFRTLRNILEQKPNVATFEGGLSLCWEAGTGPQHNSQVDGWPKLDKILTGWQEVPLNRKISEFYDVGSCQFISIEEKKLWAKSLISMYSYNLKKVFVSDLIVQLYNWNKSCQKCHFKQHWYPWLTFQDASFSPHESAKFSRFEKFKDNSYFKWHCLYTVLIKIKVVRNSVINKFELHDQLSRVHRFLSKRLWSWQNSAISQKK